MKVGYIRVSTKGQNVARQVAMLEEYGCEEIFIDKKTGKNLERENYHIMKSYVRKKDIIVFAELERLGRNRKEINQEWDYFIKKGVDIVVLDMPILDTTKYTDELGELLLNVAKEFLSYNAEQELKKILYRQKQGIEIAKQEGKYKGRSRSYAPDSKNIEKRRTYYLILQFLKEKKPIKQISEELNVDRKTIRRIRNEDIEQ